MSLKKVLPFFILTVSTLLVAQENASKYKFYGFIQNDFYYNSRQNVESCDGLFHLFPKPISLNAASEDLNANSQAEMLSINSRLGIDISGSGIWGARSSAKVEADFAGFGSSFYVLRIRQAYLRLNWKNTELLLGQTWSPFFGNVSPTTASVNAGAPFQPFNRSPQFRIKQNLNKSFVLTASAMYEMQYTSQGPIGSSNSYMKNALLPDVFLGIENKTESWISGAGAEMKTIKPLKEKLTSASAMVYSQYAHSNFQIKAKAIYGENMSDQAMLGGYGISGTDSYTNFNTATGWLNIVYGSKYQASVLLGLSQNLGTNQSLMADISTGKFTVYGYGTFSETQMICDRIYRLAPNVSYNLSNLKLALEYDLTSASYGTLTSNGRVTNPYTVNNHRIVASVAYLF